MSDKNEIRQINDDDAYTEIKNYITSKQNGTVIDILDISCALNLDDIQTHRICMKILNEKNILTIEDIIHDT